MTADLLPLVARGDQAAVRQCIGRYGGLVWTLAQRMLGSHAEAEDAAQDIFIELWQMAPRFDPTRSSEKTFVTMVARRRLIDRLRARGRRPRDLPLLDGPGGGGDARDGLEEAHGEPPRVPGENDGTEIERAAEAALAAGVLSALRPDERRALQLAVLHGLSHAEIAEAMDIPLGSAKTHVRTAVARVRALLLEKDARAGRRAS